MLQGSYTAMITPFTAGGVDWPCFDALVERQIAAGTHGLVPSGTTGESPTLSHEEHSKVAKRCVEIVRSHGAKVKVLAGTGSNATSEAVMLTQQAEQAGADAALLAVPYYNKPTQEGLFQHFKAVHDATTIPLMLYNIPGRSVVDLHDSTIARLAALPRIVGVKDATGDLSRPQTLMTELQAAGLDAEAFVQFSGEDGTALEFNAAGGTGCISVTANLVPDLCAKMQQASLDGDAQAAQDIQQRLMPLHDVLFCETSPGPVKWAAARMGLCQEILRLPLVVPDEAHQEVILTILQQLELVE